jgi:methyl-accepting chemotaxis protein
MDISKKDLADIGEAVESLGQLVESQLASLQQKVDFLSNASSETSLRLKEIQKKVNGIESILEDLKDNSDDFSAARVELNGLARNLEKLSLDLQGILPESGKNER